MNFINEDYEQRHYKRNFIEGTVNSQFDKLCLEFGNCFRTKEEAEVAKYKIKEMLNKK